MSLRPVFRLPGRQTPCYGTHIGNIQDKYFFFRRNCKNGYVRRKWGNKDKNKIEDICHKISRRIVDKAKEKNLLIVFGDLEDIQEQEKGKEMNRKLHNFPHWKLRNYIKYKAKWIGIEVVKVDETYTPQRCSRYGKLGYRHKRSFKCDNCGLETDTDENGAHNIAIRGIGKFEKISSDTGGIVAVPEATTDELISAMQVSEVGGNL
ncbi:MAG: IS605 OrfB-like transposable element containing RNAse H-like and Zn finger domain [Candidatus Methanohalarchaeum thermophilum]|uniref:IS605 OrfB-like transposable element containing RNAse H-like and Zn finger domain n=1 Tax=Methanohalarchaeum thermophilum TaxID=1903181 RepID=A0A1Q6DVT2_METT1|nr:MAG: IS605 OrfB-like transposable element containing RNAse H-like and Zn finger domain [Candidatus Methanohalarchaeum thermophilum]